MIQILLRYALIYLIILAGAIFLSYKFNKKICSTLAPSILVIVLILYVFGLIGILKYGIYFVIFLYLGLGIYSFVRFVLNHEVKTFFKNNVGVLGIFSILFFILAYTTYEKTFCVWDEFTLWSIACKNMYLLDDFITNPNCTFYLPYPPNPTILQYFFTKIIGVYSQGIELFASQIFGFSLLFSLFKNVNKKIHKLFSLIIIVCIPAIFVESLFYYSIYVDTLLGLLIGYILFEYFTSKKETFMYVSIGIALAVMSLTKSTGFFISLIVIGILVLYKILVVAKETRNVKKFFNDIRKNIKILVVFLLICFSMYFSWNMHVNKSNNGRKSPYAVSDSYEGNPIVYTLKVFVKSFVINDSYNEDNLSVKNLYNDVFDKNYYSSKPVNMSAGAWIIIFLIISMCTYKYLSSKDQKKFAFFIISVLIGFIIYIAFLQVAYILEFSNEEAVLHNSLQRYIGTFLTAILFCIIGCILYFNNQYKKSTYIYAILTLFVLMFTPITPIANSTLVAGTYNSIQKEQLSFEKNLAERLTKAIPKSSLIYPVHQTSNQDSHLIRLRYFLTPEYLPITDMFGEQRNLNQIGASSVEEWQEMLYNSFNYVYILKSNEYFNNKYNSIFENNIIEEWCLYKVERNSTTKTVLLVKTEY